VSERKASVSPLTRLSTFKAATIDETSDPNSPAGYVSNATVTVDIVAGIVGVLALLLFLEGLIHLILESR